MHIMLSVLTLGKVVKAGRGKLKEYDGQMTEPNGDSILSNMHLGFLFLEYVEYG